MTDFANKTVLITGCASGIGRLMAHKIAARGGSVIMWDVNFEGVEDVRRQLTGWGYSAAAMQCDLSDGEAIRATAAEALDRFGPVDILINNAGIVSGRPVVELTDEAIVRTFQVNTLAVIRTIRAFLPAMREQGSGHIVSVASAAGYLGAPKLSDYAASKAAVIGFDDVLRLELREDGYGGRIRTTVIAPFFVNTGMFAGVQTRFPWLLPIQEPEAVARQIVRAIEKNKERVITPPGVLTVFPGRLLPVPLFDALVRFTGVTTTTRNFSGPGGV